MKLLSALGRLTLIGAMVYAAFAVSVFMGLGMVGMMIFGIYTFVRFKRP